MKKTIVILAALALVVTAAAAGQNTSGRAVLVIPGAGGSSEMMKDDYLDVRVELSDMDDLNATATDASLRGGTGTSIPIRSCSARSTGPTAAWWT